MSASSTTAGSSSSSAAAANSASKYQTFSHQHQEQKNLLDKDQDDNDSIVSFNDPTMPSTAAASAKKSPLSSIQFLFSKILYVVTGVIILLVLAVIIFVLIVMSQTKSDQKDIFEYDDMFNGKYASASWSPQWTQKTEAAAEDKNQYVLYVDEETNLVHQNRASLILEEAKGSTKPVEASQDNEERSCSIKLYSGIGEKADATLIDAAALKEKKIACGTQMQFDSSHRYFAFKTEVTHVFRYSTVGYYLVYDTQEKKWISLSNLKQKTLHLCSATRSYWVGADNNIYMWNLETNKHVPVTTDGHPTDIFNGISDWVYEEDVWEKDVLFSVSPDCNRISFLRLNDTKVQDYHYATYDILNPYPKADVTRYPVSGSPIPDVQVRVSTCSDDNCELSFTHDLEESQDEDVHGWVFQLLWTSSDHLVFTTTDRIQTVQYTRFWDAVSNTERVIDTFRAADSGLSWLQYPKSLVAAGDSSFVELKPNKDYYHIRHCDFSEGKTCADSNFFVTSGKFNVLRILTVQKSVIFYTATLEKGTGPKELESTTQYIYRLNLADADAAPTLLPGQKEPTSTSASFYSVSLSPSATAYALYYEGPDVPTSSLVVQSDESADPTIVVKENNEALNKLYTSDSLALPSSEVRTVKLNGEQMDLLLVKPPNFRETISYPTLLYFYGGPGSKMVSQQFSAQHSAFSLYMASQGFIVATLDNRGTGAKTASFMQATYKRLGVLEAQDQMALKEYLSDLSYVDENNIAIWGWSFGGFLTLKASTDASYFEKDAKKKPFRIAISVAPVTDWSYYNAAYTERYMQTPAQNPEGYDETSIVKHIETSTYNGTSYLLNHGSADDNVHPLNSWNLIEQLQEHEVQFDLMIYPNRDHSIGGVHRRRFLYRKLSNHLMNNLYTEE